MQERNRCTSVIIYDDNLFLISLCTSFYTRAMQSVGRILNMLPLSLCKFFHVQKYKVRNSIGITSISTTGKIHTYGNIIYIPTIHKIYLRLISLKKQCLASKNSSHTIKKPSKCDVIQVRVNVRFRSDIPQSE